MLEDFDQEMAMAPAVDNSLIDTQVRITFKLREREPRKRRFWRDALLLMVDPSDSFAPSKVEKAAKKYIREQPRLLNTNLCLLAAHKCYQAVIVDEIYTILLTPELEIEIDDELLISAIDVRVDTLSHHESVLKRVALDDISRRHHVRKKLDRRGS